MQRQALEATYRDKTDIFYGDTQQDGYGGVHIVWVQKYWGVPCRIYGMTGRFTIAEGGIEYPVTQKLLCSDDVDILKGDKVSSFDGENYIALQSNIVKSFDTHHREVLLGRLEE
jgi:hypothetical protein